MMKTATPFLLAALALTAACDPATMDPANANRNQGAAVGVATGAIAGALAGGGDNIGAIAAGAVAGGILGAGVGSYLDRQAADLRKDLGNDQISVTNTGDRLLVNFPESILFATDSASLSSASRYDLQALARNLNQYPDSTIQVIGHTDSTGSAGHNFDLSTRRAGAVASVLVDTGVRGSRITATGKGEDAPVASNATTEGRAQNRRVEVVIRPTV